MAYALQFQTSDTIAVGSTLNSGATSTTLTTGNFGSPSGTQLYVVDYDVPGSAEIISATVSGTAVTSITRGLAGGAASTTNHAAGAKVACIFVPQHYANGLGSVASNDAWTAWTASPSGFASFITNETRYMQLGKTVWCEVNVIGTSNSNSFGLTLPVAAKVSISMGPYRITDGGSNSFNGLVGLTASSTSATLSTSAGGGTWTNTATTKAFTNYFFYEAL